MCTHSSGTECKYAHIIFPLHGDMVAVEIQALHFAIFVKMNENMLLVKTMEEALPLRKYLT